GSNVSNPVSGNLGGAGILGQYGTLVLNANGSYTYTANPNAVTANAVDHFVYTITDGDGDTSTVTLDITVNNVTVTASDTDALVYEKGLPAGSDAAGNSEIFNGAITPAGGTGPYTYTLNSSATGSYGNLVLNADGTYTYTLTKTYDGATANNGITTEQDKDSFTYTVTDAHGNTTTGTILVDIVDDVPTAHADTNSVSEGSQVSGNVLTDGTADVLGADGAAPGGAVTGVATGSNVSNPVSGNLGGAGIVGQYGTLVLNANGSYTYTANPNAVT
ncbi:structural toxin protein RtxA, partial [Mesorhizobium sp. M2A.F.Ca.ET.037.01.1.1]|uniref:Ig-like domain-containing protein n=1 Tax=Mesorhizobium sp. M2A.F.Ca.ET.037.01.1.1 TaxID=2496748 RepID=UPI000FD4CA25